jgi:CubicO group peptidase (beta-lactamase class C family)
MGHLGIVFQNVYKKPAHQFLWERLLEPIGFSGIDFHNPPSDSIKWFSAGGLCMTPRDYARFACLLLHDGKWGDQQIVSSKWIQKFRTSLKYPNIRSNIDGCFGEKYPKDMFRIAGSGINIAFIIPSLNMIVLRTGRVDNALWDEVEKQFLEKLFNAVQK